MANKLSAAFCAKANRQGRYGDGHGLFVLVERRADRRHGKVFTRRLRINGKPCDLGLGQFPVAKLQQARTNTFELENRRATLKGHDPQIGWIATFADAAEKVIALHEPTWRDGAKSVGQWRDQSPGLRFPSHRSEAGFRHRPVGRARMSRAELERQARDNAARQAAHSHRNEMGRVDEQPRQ